VTEAPAPRSFEEAYADLEEIVARLERGDVSVDEALELWQQGESAYRLCMERLTAAESRIETLVPRSDDTSGESL
jgi:exodeoxyribonuclease VII small subunit